MSSAPLLISLLGPTATGKTRLACEVAYRLGGEVISADSRQVFRGLDLGTGKDLADYHCHGVDIPYHLIDICDVREEYNAYRFMGDFARAFDNIISRGRQPVLCGGTGLYADAVIRAYRLPDAPVDPVFRASLAHSSDQELTERLASLIHLHNHTDTETRDRLVRALEIAEYQRQHPDAYIRLPQMRHSVFGLALPREAVVARIEARLRRRLDEGMTDEVQRLLDEGVPVDRLLRLGLEYRHVTLFLTGQCSRDQMFDNLFTDIRRFSKRQMTWFRRMERSGVAIQWLDASLPVGELADILCRSLPSDFVNPSTTISCK